ncbi:MAG: cation:proton antiporter [Verrucomicrobiales bacterium]
MHGIEFLQDLAVVLIVAGIVTIIFHRFKQPVVLGYILAGAIIGPHTPPFPLIHEPETIKILAELGVILLMFSLGLEFNLRKLKKVGAPAFIAALMEILLMVWVGYELGRAFGWSTMDSIFLGAILSISSTTIIIKALAELGKTKEPFAQLIFGILIIEDILGIAMIALLSGIAMTGALSFQDVGITLGKLGIFLAVTLVFGLIAVPRLIGYVARFKSNEMMLITVLGLLFGFSLLAVKLGYSVALGAFLIGAVIAEAREIHRIETLTEPVRDMFSAIFFVAIGLLIDPKVLVDYWLPILVITLAVVIGKVLTCSLGAFAGGNDTRTSLRVGMGLAQIGEFSFIIASLGLSLKVTSDFLYPVAVAVSAITTLLTPFLIKSADGLVNKFDRHAPQKMVAFLDLYTRWLGAWRNSNHPGMARKLIRKWTLQMTLNMALASGVFIAASFLGIKSPAFLNHIPGGADARNGLLWFSALLISLPLFIATYRKLQAFGMLLGELAVHSHNSSSRSIIPTILGNVVPVIGAVAMGLLVLLLSSAILPSGRILIPLMLIVAVIGILLRRSMVKIYAKAQFALGETFADKTDDTEHHVPAPAPFVAEVLKSGKIEGITLPPRGIAVKKLIRELGLRSLTGSTIIAIERKGQTLISPGPDEELYEGDQVLILGNASQVEAARAILTQQREESEG